MTVKDVLEIRKIMKLLDKISFCKDNCYGEKSISFLNSIEKQYIEKNTLSNKQFEALDRIYNNIIEEREISYDEMMGFHLDW